MPEKYRDPANDDMEEISNALSHLPAGAPTSLQHLPSTRGKNAPWETIHTGRPAYDVQALLREVLRFVDVIPDPTDECVEAYSALATRDAAEGGVLPS